jgi:acetamidase/formamidase
MPSGPLGGNLDTRHITKGSILHLPVQHAGTLFSCGDAHAGQGDGEVCIASLVVGLKISEIGDQPNWIVSSYLPLAIFG